jgi:hypothetical protein
VILFVTGASGAGKTAAVRVLEGRRMPGIRCRYFDSIGVPSTDEMTREYGSPDEWQAAMTREWVRRLRAEGPGRSVLDGQVRPTFIMNALGTAEIPGARIVLLDCAAEERARRLAGPRAQPELVNARMDAWAAYLRGQADALGLRVIDTTGRPVDAVADALAAELGDMEPH